jgi:enoyl-CoA hydratase/carnithine racemase
MPDLTGGPVRYEVHGDVAEIVLDRPPLNLYGAALQDGMVAAVARAAAERPRALIFRAEGDVFTAGVDVHGFDGQDAGSYAEKNGGGLALTQALEDLPLPTIAVVHGLCLTVGLELSLACDLLWAADDARFGLVERRVGISPGMGGTQRMAERAGTARAREFVMTGRLYGAEELREWGVVNRVVPRGRLLEEARAVAADLAAGPTLAMAATKAVVRAQADEGTRGADARIAELTAHLIETEDARTAVAAFLADGPGVDVTFRGR